MKTNNETKNEIFTPFHDQLDNLERRLSELYQKTQDITNLVAAAMDTKATPHCPTCRRPSSYDKDKSVQETFTRRRDDPNAGVVLVARTCSGCEAAKIAEAKTNAAIEKGIPKNLAEMDWGKWTQEDQSDTMAATIAKTYRPGANSRPILYVHGRVGTGKSSLAVCIAKGWTASYRWVNQVAFMQQVRRQYGRRDIQETPVEFYVRPSLLILDEFGLMVGGRDEVANLYELLNTRIAEGRTTILTSNSKPQDLIEEVGEPTVSRILSAAQVIELKRRKR